MRVSANKQQIELRFFNPNWVSLLSDGTCVKPRVQAWSSYSRTTIRRSYVWGALKRMQGYGCDPAADGLGNGDCASELQLTVTPDAYYDQQPYGSPTSGDSASGTAAAQQQRHMHMHVHVHMLNSCIARC